MAINKFSGKALLLSALLSSSTAATAAGFDITLNFTGGLSTSQQAVFTQAELFWESVITGYQAGINLVGLTIDASAITIDGAYGILGQAGWTNAVYEAGYVLATTGIMEFDTADLTWMESDGTFVDVIKHEMGHVIGFGSMWSPAENDISANGSGQYTGAAALAAYQAEFNQPLATFVPVELGGGPGTVDAHWNEVDNGTALTGIVDGLGRDMRDELMTGFMNSPSPSLTFLSNTTKASFVDIGYTVAGVNAPVPVPAAVWLFASGLGLLGFGKKRKVRSML